MTNRLYYNEPYNREFDATVVRVEPEGDGGLVLLDRTAFYPTSGGQPFDTGVLAAAAVKDVRDDENGLVWHLVDRTETLQAGQTVHGVIDWLRRFDHMQQHTGQHILSAAFDRLHNARTVSFHLGAELSTIDLDGEFVEGDIRRAEDEANRVVWDDRPVSIRYVDEEEARGLPLRKEPARDGMLRLIEIDGFDLSACGGTHVARTGAVGIIAVTAWERFKGGQRLSFACGQRALARHRLLRDSTAASMRLLSTSPSEIPTTIEKLQSELRDARRARQQLEGELAVFRARSLVEQAVERGGVRFVVQAVEGDANALKLMASAIAREPNIVAALVSSSSPHSVAIAVGPGSRFSARDAVSKLTAAFGGRGGGRDDFAQAGGLTGPCELILNALGTL